MSTRRRRPVKKINYSMKKKLAVLFSLVLLALVGLVARITYINATSGSKYRKQVLSQAQQKYENQTLPAKEAISMTGTGISWQPATRSIMWSLTVWRSIRIRIPWSLP